jgi:hypothetical protein
LSGQVQASSVEGQVILLWEMLSVKLAVTWLELVSLVVVARYLLVV